jgi:uncharacterized protein with NRDE domain
MELVDALAHLKACIAVGGAARGKNQQGRKTTHGADSTLTFIQVCTLIALYRVHCDFPLVVAANRDELYARKASGPQVLARDPVAVGGRDEEKGGTWLGAAEAGYFVGLTNQRPASLPPVPAERSRGEVVLGALSAGSLDAALAFVRELDARRYESFNLLFGDARRLFVAYARRSDAAVEVSPLEPGIWTLPNDRLGSKDFPKIDRAARLAAPLVSLKWGALVPRAQEMLADHEMPSGVAVQALCVHTPIYGTRSAALLAFSERGVEHYLAAEGAPCQSMLEPKPELVAALGGRI